MKRNNHSVNVGEGDDSDSTISLDLLMIPDCDILRPLDGASIGHPDDGAAHWNIHGGAAGARENATESTQIHDLPFREPPAPEQGGTLKNHTGTEL
jgi:hypothetical protein